jgi:hypothetical protein
MTSLTISGISDQLFKTFLRAVASGLPGLDPDGVDTLVEASGAMQRENITAEDFNQASRGLINYGEAVEVETRTKDDPYLSIMPGALYSRRGEFSLWLSFHENNNLARLAFDERASMPIAIGFLWAASHVLEHHPAQVETDLFDDRSEYMATPVALAAFVLADYAKKNPGQAIHAIAQVATIIDSI